MLTVQQAFAQRTKAREPHLPEVEPRVPLWRVLACFLLSLVVFVAAYDLAAAQVVPGLEGPVVFPRQFDTNLIMWSALLSQIAPYFIARINKTTWSHDRKIAVALAFSIGTALVTTAFMGKLDLANIATSALIVFTLASFTYKNVLKGSETINRLERA